MKNWAPLGISLFIATCFIGIHLTIEAGWFTTGPLSRDGIIRILDRKALDYKFKNQQDDKLPAPQVIVAGIDEKSIRQYGMWPWDRSIIADFIDVVSTGQPKGTKSKPRKGAKVIAFDAAFSDDNLSKSFIGADVLLQTYDGSALPANSPTVTNLHQSLQDLVEMNQATSEAVRTLNEQLSTPPAPSVSAALTNAKQSNARSQTVLSEVQQNLKALSIDSQIFYDLLSDKVKLQSSEQALAQSIARAPQTILGYILFVRRGDIVGISTTEIDSNLQTLKPSAIDRLYTSTEQKMGDTSVSLIQPLDHASIADLHVHEFIAALTPVPEIAAQAKQFGPFNAFPDADGPHRRLGLLYKNGTTLYPALSLITAATYFEAKPSPISGELIPNTLAGVHFAEQFVPTTPHGELLLNYYKKPEEYFPTYSVADFIDGTVSPELYEDKVVLFGMTSLGLYDLRPNPFSAVTPGVYIHAVAIQNMIDGRYLQRFYGIALAESIAYLLLSLLLGLLLPRLPAWSGILTTLGISGALYLVDSMIIFPSGTWVLIVFPILQASSIFVATSVYGYLTEGREKRKIRKAFEFYLNKSIVDEVLQKPQKLKLGGEKRVCTVLFSDIRGFTTISERLEADRLVTLLNEYLTPMTNLVFKYDGTLDKYMGDAIMVIFGAPAAQPDHAVRACKTALDMMQQLAILQVEWRKRGLPEIDIGIGLNTGPMSVGNMGSEIRFDYTVMGDNVNLGSRLEGINKQYGTNIIISEYTYEAAKNEIFARELDSVRVKGKREPVKIYELLGAGAPSEAQQELIKQFAVGIKHYKAQQWADAKIIFNHILQNLAPNDMTARTYLKRCEAMEENPPSSDWDGVFSMNIK